MKALPTPTASTELELAEVVMPSFDGTDGRKRRYLSFRLCAFSKYEAAARSNVTVKTVKKWAAEDANFAKIETTDLLTLRKLFAKDFVAMQFTRNMKLALDRDEVVLDKALAEPSKLTDDEQSYLLKIRPLYTPDGLKAVEELAQNTKGSMDDWSFDQLVIISRRISQKAFPAQPNLAGVIEAVGRLVSDAPV